MTREARAVFRARGLAVGYRAGRRRVRKVLEGIDLDLRPGELVCLLGPNGAGKSTLLRTLAGLQAPLAGGMDWGEEDKPAQAGPEWARQAAIVLTDRVETGNLSVYSLAALGRHPFTDWTGRLREEDHAAVRRALEAAGAWDLRERPYAELSDGEKQKAMVARALAQEPSLLLLDEPTAFLDLPRRVEIMRGLRRLARERGRAVLLSTHDLDLAIRAADRLWLLPAGGPLISGVPEDLVLRGDFAAVFDQGDVSFDRGNGQFRVHDHPFARARIDGEAVLRFWTARALEREGYACAEAGDRGDPDLHITVTAHADGPRWECRSGGPGRVFPSLEDLIHEIRARAGT
jgi:iron complex transport system ATP-binding protein